MSSLTRISISRKPVGQGRAFRLSSAMSIDAQAEEAMLRSLDEWDQARNRDDACSSTLVRVSLPLEQRAATLVVDERKRARFVHDEAAFIQGEPIEEIRFPTPKRWQVPVEIVRFRKATYVPNE